MVQRKHTKSEDEYFAREDAEKIKRLKERLREEILQEKKQTIKEICFMKCPKCGGTLQDMVFHGVKVDKCTYCGGVWLDKGDLEKLAGHEEKSRIGEILDLFKSSPKVEEGPVP
jgi:Zn-finger nucleic acid-binding protein